MKTKQKISLLIIVTVIVVTAISLVWYFFAKTFLRGVEPSDIKYIMVFDFNTGKGFDINDTGEIRYIIENIQDNKMKRNIVPIGYNEWGFLVMFCDESEKGMECFTINSVNTIRKEDPFLYRCDGDLCFDYLNELEAKYSK